MDTFVDHSGAIWSSPYGKIKFKNGTFTPNSKEQNEWMLKRGFKKLNGVICPICGAVVKNAGALNLHKYRVHGIKKGKNDGSDKENARD